MPRQDTAGYIRMYQSHRWRIVAILLISYLVINELTLQFLPASAELHLATAIALGALFFGGVMLWPAVYLTALFAAVIAGMSELSLLIVPIVVTLQATLGAYLLNKARVDPLFRRYRDMFYLMATIAVISLISPAVDAFTAAIRGVPYTSVLFGHAYTAALFFFLIITPFILRWFTKTWFKRTPLQLLELVVVFAVLIGINYALFTLRVPTVFGFPLVYVLLMPLFWIALRLRPRFVTLALLITSVFAIQSVLAGKGTGMLSTQLFEIEALLIVLATIFYVMASAEEDRRVHTDLVHSQLGTLQDAIERVRSESKAKNDFIAILAHELRNPLAPIASGIEALKLTSQPDTQESDTLDIMADRMNTVRHLLDDLLEISRISEGKVTLKYETVNLESVLRRAILSTDHHRKELRQSLIYSAPEKPLYVAGDQVRIEQIFSNLLTNASKYSDEGDTITLLVQEQDRVVEIAVIDEGIGLSSDVLETIFRPFQQVEQGVRAQRGLGIGLALVHSFAQMHRGSVVAASKGPGQGSRFTVRLPLLSPPAQKRRKLIDAPSIESLSVGRNADFNVLVVDDNDAAAAGIGRLLELQGCTVAYAYTGAQAIEKASSLSPQAILLDVGLPDMDGYTVAQQIRARGFTGHLVALTGYSTGDAREQATKAGFDHYLVKPTGLADLRRVLKLA
jgi:signal transduction histidine kinase